MTPMSSARAVVLLSGGVDSATTLAIARAEGFACHALSFDYGQRHAVELEAAKRIAARLGAVEHRVMKVALDGIGGSALTDDSIPVPTAPSRGIPVTYVPARNTVFLSLALAWAEVLGARDLFLGVNAIDYSGYPDCRPEFIAAFEHLAQVATRAGVEGSHFRVHAPLIQLSKADIVRRATELGIDLAATVSCYQPDGRGRACGACDSCRLRREAFESAGIPDPTSYR
jgi:7-cyano-7-deazaguanine synthase